MEKILTYNFQELATFSLTSSVTLGKSLPNCPGFRVSSFIKAFSSDMQHI